MVEPGERKLYVIVRKDQSASQRAVMAAHVAADMAFHLHPTVSSAEWTAYGPPITLMAVRNRHRLERLANETPGARAYSDPDVDDGVCAVAIYAWHWNHDWARLAEFGEVVA